MSVGGRAWGAAAPTGAGGRSLVFVLFYFTSLHIRFNLDNLFF